MHTRPESYVDGAVEIGCEEDYALEVFQLAEEDCWSFVSRFLWANDRDKKMEIYWKRAHFE